MTAGLISREPQAGGDEDARFMAATLEFARRGWGQVAPNPAVGALIVKDGVIIGRGHTRRGGRPHAETEALREAGAAAAGATLYVTLEPCSHHGKTPPCAEAIVAAGIARVVSALEDPDPRVAGRGHAILRKAGIAVQTGVLAAEAHRGHLGHILRVTAGRPMVTLKLAETADGFAASVQPAPRLTITGELANAHVHLWRAQHDAIMVGIGTVLADDPLLTVRLPGMETSRPLRIVLDARLDLPATSRLAQTAADHPTLVLAGEAAPQAAAARLTACGIEVARLPCDAAGRIDLAAALRALGDRGLTRVFSEGGPRVAASLIACGFADRVIMLTGQRPIGCGIPALDKASRDRVADASLYRPMSETRYGHDLCRVYERVE